MADSLSLAFLALLESLSPEQRAVLLLRDVFDYGYEEIAGILGKSEDNAPARHARDRVARTLLAWMRQGAHIAGASMRQVTVNGGPGALMLDGRGRLIGVMALDIAEGQVQGISSIVNPDRLRHVGPVADMRALLASRES